MKIIFIFILALCFSPLSNAKICQQIESKPLKGQFINNDNFDGEYTYCRFNKPEEENISRVNIKLKIDAHNNNYIYEGGPNPVVEVSELGVISIYDKFGGMQSPAKITYLASENKKLIKLGEINLSYELGQVFEYSIQHVDNNINTFNAIILAKKQDNFIGNEPLSYADAFLLLLSDRTIKVTPTWRKKFYSKLQVMWYQDIINLYNQNVFFKDTTLCKKDNNEKDVFGCKIKNDQLSICYSNDNQYLLYRFGSTSNIQLELMKEITEQDKDSKIIHFENTNTNYLIDTEEDKEGITINQNEQIIYQVKCEPDSIEPMILNGFH